MLFQSDISILGHPWAFVAHFGTTELLDQITINHC